MSYNLNIDQTIKTAFALFEGRRTRGEDQKIYDKVYDACFNEALQFILENLSEEDINMFEKELSTLSPRHSGGDQVEDPRHSGGDRVGATRHSGGEQVEDPRHSDPERACESNGEESPLNHTKQTCSHHKTNAPFRDNGTLDTKEVRIIRLLQKYLNKIENGQLRLNTRLNYLIKKMKLESLKRVKERKQYDN